MAIIDQIIEAKQRSRKLLVVLIDPEKAMGEVGTLSPYLSLADMVFVGGSTGVQTEDCIATLRRMTQRPIVLFPGNIAQFTPQADALLFLTLLNARTPDILIDPHMAVATRVLQSGIESIPMGYILVDGARESSVERATHCVPMPQDEVEKIVSMAAAGQLMGKSLIYLEAGSGANMPVAAAVISAVREHLRVPLIVGGGICTPAGMLAAFEAGADIVVIGNHFEQYPNEIVDFVRVKNERYGE